jgi:hypothetical protein
MNQATLYTNQVLTGIVRREPTSRAGGAGQDEIHGLGLVVHFGFISNARNICSFTDEVNSFFGFFHSKMAFNFVVET